VVKTAGAVVEEASKRDAGKCGAWLDFRVKKCPPLTVQFEGSVSHVGPPRPLGASKTD